MTTALDPADFEKLGAFYLGRGYDAHANAESGPLTLYDSRDLTTHAIIIGMTGSGKTGLGIGMIEEAAIDKIPVIAIDPKGDLANLMLTFPRLRAEDFRPWIDEQEAARSGVTPDAYAESEAKKWREGLAEWSEAPERIARLRESAEFAVFTPGSSAGIPISVLRSFSAPPEAARGDRDRYLEHVQSTATSLLALLGIAADPVNGRESILIANLLRASWDAGHDLDLGALINGIQRPPFSTIGVMDVESVYPAADRAKLAMRLNNLLASPGFEVWRQGVPLATNGLLYTESGKPRVSVISIAHLSDAERMFFVSMLLSDMINWMRTQSGTGSLRAMLYMDELFGYMPPVANPPSKTLLLSLLKQARAFGVGLVLATQNPVDLDYKGLSNAGTWCIGRLQTERDKARVMDGLAGAATSASGTFDRSAVETLIAGLDKRVFYLHNVHEDAPAIFETRWTMSYLAGPLTRDQIRRLTGTSGSATAVDAGASSPDVVQAAPVAQARPAAPAAATGAAPAASAVVLPPGVSQYFLPVKTTGGSADYSACALGAADIAFTNARQGVNATRRVMHSCAIDDGPVPVDWEHAVAVDVPLDALAGSPVPGATQRPLPDAARSAKAVASWAKSYARWLRSSQSLTLYQSATFKLVSDADETEGAFRARLQLLAREKRDAQAQALQAKFAARTSALQDRLARAEQAVQREQGQAHTQTWGAFANVGTAIIGAVLGRKRLTVASASRVGTAVRGISRAHDAEGDVSRAQESAGRVREQLTALNDELQQAINELAGVFDAQHEPFTTIEVRPTAGQVSVHFVGIGWLPDS
ncbi:MAG: helicase HerA domain-containing protein [Gemmatimonadaceae bacterium]